MNTSTIALTTPTLWVLDLLAVHHLSPMFQLMEHKQAKEEIVQGEHYILAQKDTPESTIKAIAWRVQSAGFPCFVYSLSSSLPLEYLAPDPTTARELTVQIFEHSLPFDDWRAANDHHSLDLYKAADLASLAIALLPESKKLIELGTLRKRCNENSYDWNKLMRSLEKEFQLELSKRGIKLPDGRDEQFQLDLLDVLNESDPIKKLRLRAKVSSFYRLKTNEVEQALKLLSLSNTKDKVKAWDIDELFALESSGLQWLIPELLPKGETIILAASPKAGKTVLAIDAAFAIATGESEFLGQPVQRGKVLLISSDESLNSTRNKLIKRGFRSQDKDIRVIPDWTIDDLDVLVEQLEEFRPDVVIIDSLRRITHGSIVSENSAEFADNIYTLKETIGKYGASGILIHHTNKNLDAMGVGKIRGSSAIAGAVWGTWQLEHIPRKDPNNKKKLIIDPKDPYRILTVFARDTLGQTLNLEFDYENNSWSRLDLEIRAEEQTVRQQILSVLTNNASDAGLSGREIIELLGMTPVEGRGVYTELNRMVNKQLISCKPATGDKRTNIYSLLITLEPTAKHGDSPPKSVHPVVELNSESYTQQTIENTQQLEPQQLPTDYSTTKVEDLAVKSIDVVQPSVSEILNNSSKNGGESIDVVQPSSSEILNNSSKNVTKSISDSQTESGVTNNVSAPSTFNDLRLLE
jgi:predicted XRE-type DNA-binding protein